MAHRRQAFAAHRLLSFPPSSLSAESYCLPYLERCQDSEAELSERRICGAARTSLVTVATRYDGAPGDAVRRITWQRKLVHDLGAPKGAGALSGRLTAPQLGSPGPVLGEALGIAQQQRVCVCVFACFLFFASWSTARHRPCPEQISCSGVPGLVAGLVSVVLGPCRIAAHLGPRRFSGV